MGRVGKSKREGIYVRIRLIYFTVQEKTKTKLESNCIPIFKKKTKTKLR